VAIAFWQRIKATDALRTSAYSKTLTFTLSTPCAEVADAHDVAARGRGRMSRRSTPPMSRLTFSMSRVTRVREPGNRG
jgi:hypothetical protein